MNSPTNENKRKVMESRVFIGDDQSVVQKAALRSALNKPLPTLQSVNDANIQQKDTIKNSFGDQKQTKYILENVPGEDELQFIRKKVTTNIQRNYNKNVDSDNNYPLQLRGITPHSTRFASSATINKLPVQSFEGIVLEGKVPALSPFPNFSFDLPEIPTEFCFSIKPLTSQAPRSIRKLNVSTDSTIRKVLDELQIDSKQFSSRLSNYEW